MESYIYLASPYSHPEASVRQLRYELVEEVAARLLKKGFHVFSPIVHCHPMAVKYELPKEIAFWHKYDTMMLSRAAMLLVLRLENWALSEGLAFEIELAEKLDIPITYIDVK